MDNGKPEIPADSNKSRQIGAKSPIKAVRDQRIMLKAAQGKKTGEIAKELGLNRSTVSGVLNSPDMRELAAQISERLAAGIEDAIQTILEHVKTDYGAARDLLRNFGGMSHKVEIEHSKRLTLEELVAGANRVSSDE